MFQSVGPRISGRRNERHVDALGEVSSGRDIRRLQRFKMPTGGTRASRHKDTHREICERRHVHGYGVTQHHRARWNHKRRQAAKRQCAIRAGHNRRSRCAKGNPRRSDVESARAKRGEPHPHAISADARVHDLSERLILEAWTGAEDHCVRREHGRAPRCDPTLVLVGGNG